MLLIFYDGKTMINPLLHDKLKKINHLLSQTEHEILSRAYELDSQIKSDLIVQKDRMFDYELEVIIECFGVNDNDYPLCVLKESLKGVSFKSGSSRTRIADRVNHNEFEFRDHHPMKTEHHCWLFHSLYDHEHLDWEEIVSISYFWIDIVPRYQYRIDVSL